MELSIIATGLDFPEGPAFAPDGSLWVVELMAGNLVRYENGNLDRFEVGGRPNGLVVDGDGLIWFCDSGLNAIRQFNYDGKYTETVLTHVNNQPLSKPNDLVFDKQGNLLFTCPGDSRDQADGYVCVRRPDNTVEKIIDNKYFPNGLAFNSDGTSLVVAETYRHRLWKGDWDANTCKWNHGEVWCDIGGPDGPGGPDGMAYNGEDELYVAVYGTGQIRVVKPDGQLVKAISLPGLNPTNCAFDPSGRLGLVVTEAEKGTIINIQ